jgi:hypothetical protein
MKSMAGVIIGVEKKRRCIFVAPAETQIETVKQKRWREIPISILFSTDHFALECCALFRN